MRPTDSFLARSHREEIVRAPNGKRHLLRIGRTGVARFIPGDPGSPFEALFTWARYWARRTKTWTLEVREYGVDTYGRVLLNEPYPTREQAARRADAIADEIAAGAEPWINTL